MPAQPLFAGLIVDEHEQPVDTATVGDEPFYVIDDQGFRRHVEAAHIDRQVLVRLSDQIRGHEDLISQGTMKLIGQEDIFTKAAIEASLKNIDGQIEALLAQGFPDEMRAWLGMTGFRVVVDVHGEVLHVEQPEGPRDPDEPGA